MNKKKTQQLLRQIVKNVSDNATWFTDESTEAEKEAAKLALLEFLQVFKTFKTSKIYRLQFEWHSAYIVNLFPIWGALRESNYQRANNELISLDHKFDLLQPRIYYNLIHLLEHFLKENENAVSSSPKIRTSSLW